MSRPSKTGEKIYKQPATECRECGCKFGMIDGQARICPQCGEEGTLYLDFSTNFIVEGDEIGDELPKASE